MRNQKVFARTIHQFKIPAFYKIELQCKELEAVFSKTRPYPGIIADPITGEFGTGIPYLEYLQFLTNELNKKETNGRSTPMGHIIANQNPSHLIPPLKVIEKEAELVKLSNLAYTAARQREEESLRKSLRENTEAIATLAAASTAAIALIKETSGPDVQSLLLRASIGNDLEPSKTMAIFKLEADRRYTGKAFDIKEQIMIKLRKIGYAENIEEVSMLMNQIANVMKQATTLLTKPNPEIHPVQLLAARASHAAQQAMVIARNAQLSPDLQLPPLLPFVEPIASVAVDFNSTLPTSQEIQTIMADRIDNGNPELEKFRTICEVDIVRLEPYLLLPVNS